MDGCPDRLIVDETAEVRHLHPLQPIGQDQCLIRGELDDDLRVLHCSNIVRRPRGVRGAWHSAVVDIDSFWKLIEECRRQTRDRDERLAWLRDELSRRPLTEIVQFQVRLDEVTHEAFTWDLWAAAERIFGGWCSDDGFCYFGLWMVGLGWDAFSRAVADPDALADAPEVQCLVARPRELWNDDDWPEWESLDYVAKEAYGLLADVDDCDDAFYEAVEAEQDNVGSRGPFGEQWDVRSEAKASRKLPRLSAMFPLGPLAR
nr:DUF4240 domain-containing protein [Streptomyces bauhiniae]